MADEHHHGVMGCVNKNAYTPHLDSLAKSGVLVENCYCTYPLCVPSRLSFLSGKYASEIRVWDNTAKLGDGEATLPRRIRVNSGLIGKMHLAEGEDLGFRLLGPHVLNKREGAVYSPEKRRLPPSRFFYMDRSGVKFNSNHAHDLRASERAVRFLGSKPREPFFLVVGFISPHFPIAVPDKKYLERYRELPLPEPFEPAHPHSKKIKERLTTGGLDLERTREALALYYGLVEWLDERVGEVLGELESSGLRRRTDVIYTSDHGDMLGNHGMWMKGCLYEGAVKVPLIISDGENRGVRKGVCSSLDVAATIGAKFGVEFGRGRNLQPLMVGGEWEDVTYAQHFGPRLPGDKYMIRSGDWKYIYTTGSKDRELYNLAKDPFEKANVAEDNRGRCVALHKRMVGEFGGPLEKLRQ